MVFWYGNAKVGGEWDVESERNNLNKLFLNFSCSTCFSLSFLTELLHQNPGVKSWKIINGLMELELIVYQFLLNIKCSFNSLKFPISQIVIWLHSTLAIIQIRFKGFCEGGSDKWNYNSENTILNFRLRQQAGRIVSTQGKSLSGIFSISMF